MSCGRPSLRGRVLSRAGIGVLSFVISAGLVDEAVGDGLAWEMRVRSLPSRLGVYFVLGLCLFSGEAYGRVLRELTAGLEAALEAAGILDAWVTPEGNLVDGDVTVVSGAAPVTGASCASLLVPALDPDDLQAGAVRDFRSPPRALDGVEDFSIYMNNGRNPYGN